MKQISQRYLETENQKNGTEKMLFPNLNLWNRAEKNEKLKYTRALNHLISQISPCCIPHCKRDCSKPREKQSFVFRLINIVFFNKF